MLLLSPRDFLDQLPNGQALLGIDAGTRTLGLAVSDVTRAIATPLTTIHRTRLARDLDTLAAVVAERGIGGFVLGLPIEMDGREGRRCQSVRQFGRDLLRRIERPLLLWDERLSTAAAERLLITEADLSRRRRQRVIDRSAAAFILQGALDRLRTLAADRGPPPATADGD